MSEIIKRAAEAAEAVDPTIWVGEDRADYYERIARAVIGSLREPTEAMVRAGECEIFEHRANADEWALQATKEGWQGMIDEALK